MDPLLKILVYLLAVLLAGVLLSPPIYWLCQWLIAQGWLEMLRGFPFHRYFSRTVQVSALALLVPLVLWLRVRRLADLGIEPNPRWRKDLAVGFFAAFLPVALLAAAYLQLEIYGMRPEPGWGKLPRVAGTAAVVSLLEELFFRGVVLGLATRQMGAWGGAVFSSAVFAALHFLRPAKVDGGGPVTWSSGWEQLGAVFAGAPEMPLLAYGAASLLLAGMILAGATTRTRSLWLAIGLHAGWIFGQQGFHALAKFRAKPPEEFLPWVGPNLVSGAVPTGVVPLGVLLFSGVLVWFWLRAR